jgi:hypothetical protein
MISKEVLSFCKKILFLALFFHANVGFSQISGTVFQDNNLDGNFDSDEIAIKGIRIVAYNANGDSVTQQVTTNATTNYSFTGLTLPIRLELRLPNYYFASNGGTSRTQVEFFTASTSSANFGVSYPKLYCQNTPNVVMPTHVAGDPEGGGTGGSTTALVQYPFNRSGITPAPISLATASQIGSVWGNAYQRETKTLILSEFLKRHSGLESNGLGSLYLVNLNTNTVSTYINVENFDINLGSSALSGRTLPASATTSSADPLAFSNVGKIGIGGISLSDDGKVLWGVNLNTKQLFSFNIGNPIKASSAVSSADFASYSIPTPNCTNGVARPWAVHFHEGYVYVGVICSGETSGTVSDMYAYVYRFNVSTLTWDSSPVFSTSLDYTKGYVHISYTSYSKWESWANNFTDIHDAGTAGSPSATRKIRPQPILSDIEFDKSGNMILGFMDRTGHQTGRNNVDPNGNATLYNGYVSGEILYLQANGSGGYVLESNGGFSGDPTGFGVGNLQGPEGGEYFAGDFYDGELTPGSGIIVQIHQETAQGGLAYHGKRNEIVATHMDPLNIWSGGTARHYVSNGYSNDTMRYEVYNTVTPNGTFGKANGLGDVELICNAAPLEIGNRIWTDTNKNGKQDANESGLDGVTVLLFEGATQVGNTTTANGGKYFFTSSNVTGGIKYYTNYEIRIAKSQSPLSSYVMTTADISSNTHDLIDNDGSISDSNIIKAFTTGGAGQNDHSYDFGFVTCPTITSPSSAQSICIGSSGSNITVQTNQNDANSIKFVKFTSAQTDTAIIYAGTQIGTTVTPTGASSPYTATYTWNSADFPNVTASPITYYVYGILSSDIGGLCRPYQEIQITIKPLPTANAGADVTVTCSTPSTTLTATGGSTYAWSTGANTTSTSVTPTTTTTYTVTVTATNGCSATDAVIVTADKTVPTFSATQSNVTCFGLVNGTITINASNGTTPYQFSIDNGATFQSSNIFTNLAPNTYVIQVKGANGCISICQ